MDYFFMIIKFYLLVSVVKCYPRRQTYDYNVSDDSVNSYSFFEPEGRGSYAFGYEVDDFGTNNIQFRDEERHKDGRVEGSYGFLASDGSIYMVHYVADDSGYRANVEGPLTKVYWKR